MRSKPQISLCLAIWLSGAPFVLCQVQPPTGPPAQTGSALPLAKDQTDNVLAQYLGLWGHHTPTDAASRFYVFRELLRRVEEQNDGLAAYIIGCEYENPAYLTAADSGSALKFYQIGAGLKNPASIFKVGLYVKFGMGGAQKNEVYGQQLIDYAVSRNYQGNRDPMNEWFWKAPQASTETASSNSSGDGTLWLVGTLAAIALAASLSDSKGSSSGSSSSSSPSSDKGDPVWAKEGPKVCSAPVQKWVPGNGSYDGYYSTTYETRYGSMCP